MRRAEDARRRTQLGAQVYHMPLTEALFARPLRRGRLDRALPGDTTARFPGINDADERACRCSRRACPSHDVTAIYAPFGVDAHVDHQLVRDWALVLTGATDAPALRFYEEYPHAARNKPALQRARAFYRRQLPGAEAGRAKSSR